jgi:hypothetical protein
LVLNGPNSAYIELLEPLPLLCHTFEFTLSLGKYNYLGDPEENAPSNYRVPKTTGVNISFQQHLCYLGTLYNSFDSFAVAM